MDYINWPVRYVGISTYYQDTDTVDLIVWDDNSNIVVYHNLDCLASDSWDDYDEEICYQYIDVSNEVFDILSSVIENKPIKDRVFCKPVISNFSSIVFYDKNIIHEFLIDDANYICVIRSFKGSELNDELPLKIMEYLLKGLYEAGYKIIEIHINDDLEEEYSIHERGEKHFDE